MWRENLFSNLLVLLILVTLGIIIYCSVKKVTFMELVRSVREAFR
jgi:hypothetical protein